MIRGCDGGEGVAGRQPSNGGPQCVVRLLLLPGAISGHKVTRQRRHVSIRTGEPSKQRPRQHKQKLEGL